MLYSICTRKIKRSNGVEKFEATPADPVFLIADDAAKTFDPSQRVKGSNPGKTWALKVLADLPKDAEGRPCGDIVIFVHGFNVDEKEAYTSHKNISASLEAAGFPHVFVSYDWPSQGSFLNYLEDSLDADKAAPPLVESGIALFAQMAGPECRTRVHVMVHSMGARVLRAAFDFAGGHPATSQRAWGVNQLILVAADISSASLADARGRAMLDKAARTTNYASGFDIALATSNVKRFNTSPRAGRIGVPDTVRGLIADVDCSARWQEFGPRLREDFPFGEIGKSHTWYWSDQAVFIPDLVETLKGEVDRAHIGQRKPNPARPGGLTLS